MSEPEVDLNEDRKLEATEPHEGQHVGCRDCEDTNDFILRLLGIRKGNRIKEVGW